MIEFKINSEQVEKIWNVVKDIPTEKGLIVVDIIRSLVKIEEKQKEENAS